MARPASKPAWAYGGAASVTEPPAARKEEGWTAALAPPAAYMNWLHKNVDEWIDYLVDEFIDTHFAAEHNPANGAHTDITSNSIGCDTTITADGRIFSDAYIETSGNVIADGYDYTTAGNGVLVSEKRMAKDVWFPFNHEISGSGSLITRPIQLTASTWEIKEVVQITQGSKALFYFEVGADVDIDSLYVTASGEGTGALSEDVELHCTITELNLLNSTFEDIASGAGPYSELRTFSGWDIQGFLFEFPDVSSNYTGSGVNTSASTKIIGFAIESDAVNSQITTYIETVTVNLRIRRVEDAFSGVRV